MPERRDVHGHLWQRRQLRGGGLEPLAQAQTAQPRARDRVAAYVDNPALLEIAETIRSQLNRAIQNA